MSPTLQKATLLNRYAVVVAPKAPMLDWVQSLDSNTSEITLRDMKSEPDVYLIPYKDEEAPLEEALQPFFEAIFEDQLFGWWTVQKDWPQNRDWKTFGKFFDYKIASMVTDLGGTKAIRRESLY